jgi:hypothetical protein
MIIFRRIILIISLITCYKYLPVFEPKGINYILSILCFLFIVYEIKKSWNTIKITELKKIKIQKFLYLFAILLILVNVIFIIHQQNPAGNIRFVRGILILITLVIGSKMISFVSASSLSNTIKNSLLLVFSTISIIAIIECIFMFVSLSHGSGEAYSGKIWTNRYWNPLNKFGFRDEQPKKGKKNVFFVGDSFTAGWGVKKINNRFGEITAEKLSEKGKSINEINLGRYGADTRLEFYIFQKFIKESNIKPDHIVLQFFVNDIDKFIPNINCLIKPVEIPNWKKIINNGSYLVNYINSIYPTSNSNKLPKECEYTERLKYVYNTDTIWKKEQRELDKFKNYCSNNKIKMTLIFFPFMEDLSLAKKLGIEKRLINYCSSNQIRLLNVTSSIKHLNQNQRQSSIMDAHASDEVHKIVGRKLANIIKI